MWVEGFLETGSSLKYGKRNEEREKQHRAEWPHMPKGEELIADGAEQRYTAYHTIFFLVLYFKFSIIKMFQRENYSNVALHTH